jgi:CDGSH-type Zn-finger protein
MAFECTGPAYKDRRSHVPTQGAQEQARNLYHIKVTRNGPYVVRGGVPLSVQTIVCDANGDPVGWRMGKVHPVGPTYSLCRCGQSEKWPFCDGKHAKIHLDGTETADRASYLDQADMTEGPTLHLTDVPILCANAGFCTRAGGTWDLTERSDDPEARQTAIEQAGNCPSGRLVAWEKNGQAIEPVLEPSIGVVEHPQTGASGPFWVRGRIPIEAADGTVYEVRNRVTLCGCGRSSNKPFCDGSHSDP